MTNTATTGTKTKKSNEQKYYDELMARWSGKILADNAEQTKELKADNAKNTGELKAGQKALMTAAKLTNDNIKKAEASIIDNSTAQHKETRSLICRVLGGEPLSFGQWCGCCFVGLVTGLLGFWFFLAGAEKGTWLCTTTWATVRDTAGNWLDKVPSYHPWMTAIWIFAIFACIIGFCITYSICSNHNSHITHCDEEEGEEDEDEESNES